MLHGERGSEESERGSEESERGSEESERGLQPARFRTDHFPCGGEDNTI